MSIIGKIAPQFSGKAALHGEQMAIKSEDYKGKWLVLFFYPLDFTFVCPTEIVAFDDAYDQFKAIGAEVVGCSVDSVHTHLAYTRTARNEGGVADLKYPLLADLSKSIATAFDVLHPDGDKALRGVFVIDPDGRVQSATINNLSIGRNIDEVLRTVKAAKYAREHGEVCPANWEEGEAGMQENLKSVAQVIGKK